MPFIFGQYATLVLNKLRWMPGWLSQFHKLPLDSLFFGGGSNFGLTHREHVLICFLH